ncbi:MAG: hypothetical protein QXP41_00595 [Candidatus Nitrosocaldus sp.]
MALSKHEKTILEAISNMLSQDAKLGLAIHKSLPGYEKTTDHHSQFRWEGINDLFTLKVSDSPFKDALTSAFYAVHSHKYINDPTFKISFNREMCARAIPHDLRTKCLKYVDDIVNELSESKPSEFDAGWNPNMKDIVDVTSNADKRVAKISKPFTGGGPAPEGSRD